MTVWIIGFLAALACAIALFIFSFWLAKDKDQDHRMSRLAAFLRGASIALLGAGMAVFPAVFAVRQQAAETAQSIETHVVKAVEKHMETAKSEHMKFKESLDISLKAASGDWNVTACRSLLKELLPAEIAAYIMEHIVHEPINYQNVRVSGRFYYNPQIPEKRCMLGEVDSKFMVINRADGAAVFPAQYLFSEEDANCGGVKSVQQTVYVGAERFDVAPGAPNVECKEDGGQKYCTRMISIPKGNVARVEQHAVVGVRSTFDRYLHRLRFPATSVQIQLSFPDDLNVSINFYHPGKEGKEVHQYRSGRNWIAEIYGAALPYEAVEYFWEPQHSASAN